MAIRYQLLSPGDADVLLDVDEDAFDEPIVPIVSNITGHISTSVEELRQNAGNHMVRPVMWTNSVRSMIDHGATTFLEIGPGNVLSGLIRRIKRDVKTVSLADLGLSVGTKG